MPKEIERKFLVTSLPDLAGKQPLPYERHFLYIGEQHEIRVQKKGNKYELERKGRAGDFANDKTKLTITQAEFEHLKNLCSLSLQRESYDLGNNASLKIYKGIYEGLMRAEFEFTNEEEAAAFQPPAWCGSEITTSQVGRDSMLIRMSRPEFEKQLYNLQSKGT